jgi:hypothetical protein
MMGYNFTQRDSAEWENIPKTELLKDRDKLPWKHKGELGK